MKLFNRLTGTIQEPEPWQAALQVGDHYVNLAPIGGVLNSQGLQLFDRLPAVYGKIIKPGPSNGFFWVEAYSTWSPKGEVGLFCILEATRKLTPAEFETARRNNWQ